jgi:hypothetical protein
MGFKGENIVYLTQEVRTMLELTSKLASVREKELRIIMYLTSKFYSTLISLAE